jgi:hypothetical protein
MFSGRRTANLRLGFRRSLFRALRISATGSTAARDARVQDTTGGLKRKS